MDVTKIKYCLKCERVIEPNIEFTEERVKQKCPNCDFVLGMAGAFMISEGYTDLKMKVNIVEPEAP